MFKKISKYIFMVLLMVMTIVVPGCGSKEAEFDVKIGNTMEGDSIKNGYIRVGRTGTYLVEFSAKLLFRKESIDVTEKCELITNQFISNIEASSSDYDYSFYYNSLYDKCYFQNVAIGDGTYTFTLTTTYEEIEYTKEVVVEVVESFSSLTPETNTINARVGDTGYINVYYDSLVGMVFHNGVPKVYINNNQNYVKHFKTELDENNKCIRVYLEMLQKAYFASIYVYCEFEGINSTIDSMKGHDVYEFISCQIDINIEKELGYEVAINDLSGAVVYNGEREDGQYNAFYYTDPSFITMISVRALGVEDFSLSSLSTSENGSQTFVSLKIYPQENVQLTYTYINGDYQSIGTMTFNKADLTKNITSVEFSSYEGSLEDGDSKLCASMLKLTLLALNLWAVENIDTYYPNGIAYYLGFTSFI